MILVQANGKIPGREDRPCIGEMASDMFMLNA